MCVQVGSEYGSPMVVHTGVKLLGGHSHILFLALSTCNKINQVT